MKVQCVVDRPDAEATEALVSAKMYVPGRMTYGVKIGREYLVYGLHLWRSIPFVYVLTSTEVTIHLTNVPLSLFEVTDERVSRFWKVRHWPDGDVTLWPTSLYQDYYIEDLFDGKEVIVQDFQRLRRVLEAEADEAGYL